MQISKGGGEDTTFEAKTKDSKKVRSQGQGPSCRGQAGCLEAKDRKALGQRQGFEDIRSNINANIVIMISQAYKRKIV